MVQTVTQAALAVNENLTIRKNRISNGTSKNVSVLSREYTETSWRGSILRISSENA